MPLPDVPEGFVWPASWRPLPLPEGWQGLAGSPEDELKSEVCPGHLLYDVTCRAVAFRADDPNEFLFATSRPLTPVAFVHLTFQSETDPMWPYTVGYSSWKAFQSAWQAQEA